MKALAVALLITSLPSFAAVVKSAKLDAAKKNILIDVVYGGGCAKHTFTLKVGGCMETYPVRCTAKLVEKIEGGADFCEAIVSQEVKINLKAAGLTDSYYQGASLNITGDMSSNGISSARVVLP
jgi:hypothetical protein